jgi:MazG family protein
MEQLKRLREIARILREPGGCDWDRAQTPTTMRRHIIEEAYEVVDAIDSGNPESIREELGDLLFVVLFCSRLYDEGGLFSFDDIAGGVADKLIRRHPHVFGNIKVNGIEDILVNWNRIKAGEKAQRGFVGGVLDGVEEIYPSTMHARKIQERAARVGFDWKSEAGVFEKLGEEIGELRAEIDSDEGLPDRTRRIEEEFGDVLFTLVNLSRHLGIEPEVALRRTTHKFIERFRQMERAATEQSRKFEDLSPDEMDDLWNAARNGGL